MTRFAHLARRAAHSEHHPDSDAHEGLQAGSNTRAGHQASPLNHIQVPLGPPFLPVDSDLALY